MASSLDHVILGEGLALYRELQEWKEDLERTLQADRRPSGGRTGRRPSPRPKGLASPLHAYYPFLFHTRYPEVPLETVRELARADRLYTQHLLAYDRILDRPEPPDPALCFLAQMEHLHALRPLYALFPVPHPFWDTFHACFFETWKSFREEKLWHSHRLGAFPFDRFCSLAKGKTALLRPFTLALAFLSGKEEDVEVLCASLDLHHIALALIDDLEDWREDLRRGNFTYLLTQGIREAGLCEEVRTRPSIPPERIGPLLFASGRVESQLRQAERHFQKSGERVQGLPLPLWTRFNEGFRLRCRALRCDLAEIRRRERVRLRARNAHPPPPPPSRSPTSPDPYLPRIRSGIRFLAGHLGRRALLPLASSPHLYLRPVGVLGPSRFVSTLVFRSLQPLQALDPAVPAILDSMERTLAQPGPIHPPPRIPPALEGAFAPMPCDPDHLRRLDRAFAPDFGPLPDGLFWANFLYHCTRHGYLPPRLIAHVEDCVQRRFFRPWSFGVAFGPVAPPWTRYACKPLLVLLLLCQALGNGLKGKGLEEYLLGSHRPGEPWINTTETALTALCVLLVGSPADPLEPAVRKIAESQEPDGSWAPNAVYRGERTYYGSKALTTAWCLEVLQRYRRLRDPSAAAG